LTFAQIAFPLVSSWDIDSPLEPPQPLIAVAARAATLIKPARFMP
jgi:hypothetical protein